MIPIHEELLEQFERGNVLLFIGERITCDTEGQAVIDHLTAQLLARCELSDEGERSFPVAAQAYEDKKGRQALIQFMRDRLDELGHEPQEAHRLIARLADCNVLVTTCLDQRLERAFSEAKRPLSAVVGNVDVAFEDGQRATLYKLRGSLEQPESLVLTEDDYEAFFDNQTSISVVLQAYLARKTILFVGYDLADPHFKRLYRKVTAPLDHYARRAYAFGKMPPPGTCRWCERHGINVVDTDATAFLEALTEQLEARRAARVCPSATVPLEPAETPSAPLSERPYKLLDYYEPKDVAIFFGRREETQHLTSLIHAHRLVLLYGASGVGKTSLLLAGAVPRLENAVPPYETIYVRALEDPTLVIRRTIRRRIPEADLPEQGSLVDFLNAGTRALKRTLVIILDQFEEFFIRLSPEFRMAFITELGALYDARDVPVKVVLSLREDWLASMNEIRRRIPEVFYVDMRLLPLTRDQARQAIAAPVERLSVSYEPALVERLLDELASEASPAGVSRPGTAQLAVMPPQLQIVCSALYDGLPHGEHCITLAIHEQLGGARGMLQKYLDNELARLESDEQELARDALEELVTSQRTKAVKTAAELALALKVDVSDLESVLEKLVRARLLRPVERAEATERAYELAHEYLIADIALSPEAMTRKEMEELVQQEVKNWQRFGTLVAADKLALIDRNRDALRLSDRALELLLHSAIQAEHEMEYWLSRLSDSEQRVTVLIEATRNRQAVVRERTALLLGTQDVPGAVPPLLTLALHDVESSVRMTARRSLVQLTEQRASVVAQLRSKTEHADRQLRRFAQETWTMLPLRGLPRDLLVQVMVAKTAIKMRSLTARVAKWPRSLTARVAKRQRLDLPWQRASQFSITMMMMTMMMSCLLYLLLVSLSHRPVAVTATSIDPPTNTVRVIGNTYPKARAAWVITNTTSGCPWMEARLFAATGGEAVMPRLLQDNKPVDRVDPGESVTIELTFDAFIESVDQTWYLVVTDQHGDLALIGQPTLRLTVNPWVIGVTPTPTLTPTLALVSP